MASLLATHLIISFLSLCTDATTKINGIWSDDFSFDVNQLNGWYIYNDITGELSENPTISANHKYHGKFSKISDGRQNFMQRKFQCLQDSKVSISYSFAFCRTEDGDKTQMIWSSVLTNIKEDGMSSYSSSPNNMELTTIEDSDLFETAIQPINCTQTKYCCNETSRWRYRTISDFQVGYVDAMLHWELIFSQKFSGNNEYGLLFDISINCAVISDSVTQIDGTWFDDFLFNADQINGWNIYNEVSGALPNSIVTPTRKYHGKFTRIDDGKQNFMKRKFQCLKDSKIYISYKFGYCATEKGDKTEMVWISDITNSKIMGMNSDSALDRALNNIEGNVDLFETNIKPVSTVCEEIKAWHYQNVGNVYVGYVDAGFEWELIFSQKFSGNNEYGILFDVSINCDGIAATDSGTNDLDGNDLGNQNPNNENNKENIKTEDGSVENDTKHTNTVLIIIGVIILVLVLFGVYFFYFRHQSGLKEKLLSMAMDSKDKHANINLV